MSVGFHLLLSVALPASAATTSTPLTTSVPQEARSVFDAAQVQIVRSSPPFRRLADFDLDGDLDAVGADVNQDHSEYRIGYYANDGSGVFADRAHIRVVAYGSAGLFLEVGNLNGDAWPDLCLLKGAQRDVWLCQPPGTGAFVQQPTVALPAVASALALADFDGDGIDDVLWTDREFLRLQGSSGPADALALRGIKHGLRVHLENGPWRSHLVVAHVGNAVRIVYWHPTTGLVLGPIFQTQVLMGMVDTGDIDADGDVDAVVFGMSSYRVLRRLGRSNWSLEPALTGGPAEFLRDVDGDGDLDGVCCGGGGGGGGFAGNNLPTSFEIALNDGSGTFAPAFAIPGNGSPQLAGVADVDADGDIDLVAGRCVYFADGVVRPLRASTVIPPRRGPRNLSDCDNDGDVDAGFSVESVYDNDGRGTFTLAPSSARAPAGLAFEGPGYPGDFDGDGDVDLVAELGAGGRTSLGPTPPQHGTPGTMALLRNDGRGGLAAPVPAAPLGVTFALDAAADPERSLLVDVDGDGDLDLLTRSEAYAPGQAGTQLWANDGAGFFLPGERQAGYRVLWSGDVDLDGDVDELACGSGNDGTSTYLLLGSGPRPGRLPIFTWDRRADTWYQQIDGGIGQGDLDGDAYPDFAVALAREVYPAREALLLDNRFATGGSLVGHIGIDRELDLAADARTALGRIDGDGSLDALVGPKDSELADLCEIHFQRPGGLPLDFERVFQLVSPGQLIDLDGDGDLDILGERIAFNRSSPEGRVRRAGALAPPSTGGPGSAAPARGQAGRIP